MRAHLLSTATLAALTFVLLYETAPVLAVLFVGCVCLWLACPAMFLALQKYKTYVYAGQVHAIWVSCLTEQARDGWPTAQGSARRVGHSSSHTTLAVLSTWL